MLKLAIIRPIFNKNGQFKGYKSIIEGEDGELEREIASRVRAILGPKGSYTGSEIDSAIARAFKDYKRDFKEQTIKLK